MAKTLHDWMKDRDLTDGEVGKQVGVSAAAIQKYRTGARIPRQETMRKLVDLTKGEVPASSYYGLTSEAAA